MKKIAFVTPWYGEDISGGAEAMLRGLVHHLYAAGVDLEVLTTCVRDFRSDWSVDDHPVGTSTCAGIPVRRFSVRPRDTAAFDRVNAKLMKNQRITEKEETTFQREMVNSPSLYQYISEKSEEYSLFVFIPYMFGTTYYGVQSCRKKAVLIPCLHDEAYAYMKILKQSFAQTAGMVFLSEPEQLLAQTLYGVSGRAFQSLGTGIDTEIRGDAVRFRRKYQIDSPFLLYAGRKDAGKKVDVLIQYFLAYKKRSPSKLKLILIGGGNIEFPKNGDVIDLGFVPAQDKHDAYAAASVFCNPSQFESFSLVIMESWLAERPVLVNGDCAVTTDFARKSNGGLYYQNYIEFEKCLQYLLTNPGTARQMGANGRDFVLKNFSWDAIIKKYTEYFKMVESEIGQ